MISSAVVNRYANALVDVVLGSKAGIDPARAVQDLRGFESAVKSSAELRNVLASPAVPKARKRLVVRRIAESLEVSPIIRNFLLVISDHGRAAAVPQMADAFETLLDERIGFVRADVKSAIELNEQQRNQLASELARRAGKKVRMHFQVDPELIGGITARIGSTVYDGSVRGRLSTLRQRLTAI